jgi:hypothetical protein
MNESEKFGKENETEKTFEEIEKIQKEDYDDRSLLEIMRKKDSKDGQKYLNEEKKEPLKSLKELRDDLSNYLRPKGEGYDMEEKEQRNLLKSGLRLSRVIVEFIAKSIFLLKYEMINTHILDTGNEQEKRKVKELPPADYINGCTFSNILFILMGSFKENNKGIFETETIMLLDNIMYVKKHTNYFSHPTITKEHTLMDITPNEVTLNLTKQIIDDFKRIFKDEFNNKD